MIYSQRAFTIMELLIVVIIVGIIAGFAIPGYQKALRKSEERVAIIKLRSMSAGMKIYKAKHGNYPAFDMTNLASINQNLGLSVVADTMTYQCIQADGSGDTNVCRASSPYGWSLHWHESGGDIIHCVTYTPSCPSCPYWANGNC